MKLLNLLIKRIGKKRNPGAADLKEAAGYFDRETPEQFIKNNMERR